MKMPSPQEREEAARMARRILRDADRGGSPVPRRERRVLELFADGEFEEATRLGRSESEGGSPEDPPGLGKGVGGAPGPPGADPPQTE